MICRRNMAIFDCLETPRLWISYGNVDRIDNCAQEARDLVKERAPPTPRINA
jgi:hypothetical protein